MLIIHFIPVAIETLGPISDKGLELISYIGRRLTQATGGPKESTFFFQRLSLTKQRFNALAFSGSSFLKTPQFTLMSSSWEMY